MENDHAAPTTVGTYENDTPARAEGLSEDTMRAEMDAQYDAMNSVEAKVDEFLAQPPIPPYRGPEKGIAATMEHVYDELQKPKGVRQDEALARGLVDQRRAAAEANGLTLQEMETILNKDQAAPPAEWQAFNEKASKIAPDQKPHELADRLLEVGNFIERDPKAGIKFIADHYGVSLDQGAEPFQAIASRYQETMRGVAPVEAFEKLVAANDFLERNPNEGIIWLAQAYGVDLNQLASMAGSRMLGPKPSSRTPSRSPRPSYKPGENLHARMRAIYPQAASR